MIDGEDDEGDGDEEGGGDGGRGRRGREEEGEPTVARSGSGYMCFGGGSGTIEVGMVEIAPAPRAT